MKPRRSILTTVAALTLTLVANMGAGAASQASPARVHPARATVKATTDRYTVKLIAKLAAGSGTVIVSSNGKWVVTDTRGTDSPTIQLINVAAGKVEGTTTDTDYGKGPVGVDNAGVVYGTAVRPDVADGTGTIDDGFLWDGHTITYVPLPGDLASTCSDNKPSFEDVTFQSVNASGVAVGSAGWDCKADDDGGGGAIMFTPEDGVEFTGTYHDSDDVSHHPDVAYTIDDANIVSGDLLPDRPLVEWVNGVDAAPPQLIATIVGEPAVYPPPYNALWQGGDFVGSLQSYSSEAIQSLFHGGNGTETVTTIPEGDGTDTNSDEYLFVPLALGSKELVVGDRTQVYTKATGPAVWSVGSTVTPLASLLTSPTKDHLVSAMAIDTHGDIFGTATTSTAKNAPLYLYEAAVSKPAPAVRVTAPKNGKTYKKGAALKASYSCKAGKGATLKSCKGTKPDHHAVSTKKAGKHSFTVTATDTDGQQTKKTVHFTVKK